MGLSLRWPLLVLALCLDRRVAMLFVDRAPSPTPAGGGREKKAMRDGRSNMSCVGQCSGH